MARVDFLYDGEDRLWVNEINTLPGHQHAESRCRLASRDGVSPGSATSIGGTRLKARDRHRLGMGIKAFLAELGS